MKKAIFLTLFVGTIVFVGSLGLVDSALKNEVYHRNPCASSASPLIDSLRTQFDLWGWSSSPKNYCPQCSDFDSTKVECKFIGCRLSLREVEVDFQKDSMIHEVMNLFWAFPQNTTVDSLYLEIENNNKTIIAQLTKSDLNRVPKTLVYDKHRSLSEFSVIYKFDGEETGGGGDYERYKINTREIKLLSKVDLSDYQDIATYYYKNELDNCKKDNISKLIIEIETASPKGQFISHKTTDFLFEIVPAYVYSKKKKSL